MKYPKKYKNRKKYLVSKVDLKNKQQHITKLFKSNRLTNKVNITAVDMDGFRFFEAFIPDEKQAYRKLRTILDKTVQGPDGETSLYKTFSYEKMRRRRIDLYNPKFPLPVVKKMDILNKDMWMDHIYE